MSLKVARKIAKRLQLEGHKVRIKWDPILCKAHNPNAHPMCGKYVVLRELYRADGMMIGYIPVWE